MALIPPFFLDCVVAIGLVAADGTTHWAASGFLYGKFLKQVSETEKSYGVYLVTNRHVLADQKAVKLRFNPEEAQPAREYNLDLSGQGGTPLWFAHPDQKIDIAVVPIDAQFLRDQHIRFHWFQNDEHVANRAKATELGVTEGDGVYTLGFPLGLVGGERNFVIVRQGTIARIRDALSGASKEFLIDALIFPGNSGGPVVLRPELTAIQGTKNSIRADLLGVVSGYISYREVAISAQTRRERITFEENSGLAAVFPMDFVDEAIEAYENLLKKK